VHIVDIFTVRFVKDRFKRNEEYYYFVKEDAEYHFSLFRDDDSHLYCEIVLLISSGGKETVLDRIQFIE